MYNVCYNSNKANLKKTIPSFPPPNTNKRKTSQTFEWNTCYEK
jgi:hypothetical protein